MSFEKQVIGDNDDLEELKNNIEHIGITAQGLGSLNYPSGKLSIRVHVDSIIITIQDSVSQAAVGTRHAHVTRVQCASGEPCLVPGHVHVDFSNRNLDFSIDFHC